MRAWITKKVEDGGRDTSKMFGVRVLVVCVLAIEAVKGENVSLLRTIRECFRGNSSILCLKERALKLIDEAVVSDHALQISDYVDIVRDPTYEVNATEDLPVDPKERSEKLNEIITKRVDDFFESRTVKFNLARVFEGRAKKGGKKGGGMMLMGGLAMAGMMAQMFMGKVAFMSMAALMISKMALLLASVIGLKKLVGGSGGSDSHVVYTSGGEHGGWHRSLSPEDEAAVLAYRSHLQNSQENNYV